MNEIIRFTNGDDGVFAHVSTPEGKHYGVNVDHLAKGDDMVNRFFAAVADRVRAGEFVPPGMVQITTNGTTRTIPADEPVFLLRGQDRFAAAAVRYWTFLVEESGGDPEIVRTAREHVLKMECWPVKKTPGLPMAMTTKQLDMPCNAPFLKEAVEKLGLPNATKEFTVRIVGEGRNIEVEAKHVDIDKIKKAPNVAVDQCCGKCKAGNDASGD